MAKPFLESLRQRDRRPADAPGAGARRLAVHGLHDGRNRAGSTRPRPWRRSSSRTRGGATRQRDHDGRPAPRGDRRPLAEPRRGAEGDRGADRCRTAATDLAATFEAIDRVLDVSTIPQKEVVFLTDLQATSWRRPRAAGKDGLDADPGQARGAAAAVGGHRPGQGRRREPGGHRPPARSAGRHRGHRRCWSGRVVRNFGPDRADGVRVRLTVDGRLGPEQLGRPAGRRGRAGRLQPAVRHARRPRGRGADRRRPAAARRPPLAGRAGPRVAQRAAGRRPLQVRAVPGRDRLPGPGPRAHGGLAGPAAA